MSSFFIPAISRGSGANMIKALAMTLLIIIPVAVTGQEEYSDLIDAMTRLVSLQEKFVTTVKKTAKSDEVALAMKELGTDLREVHAVFLGLEKKYPDLGSDEKKLPAEARVLMASSDRAARQLTEVMVINLYRHGAEPAVAAEIAGLKDLLKSFIINEAKTPAGATP